MNVLVTGAASGIGRATCLRLARDGRARGQAAKVAAVDLGPSPGASRGAIVAVGSMSGSNAHANLGAYGPSKAALIMLGSSRSVPRARGERLIVAQSTIALGLLVRTHPVRSLAVDGQPRLVAGA